jgi:DNA-binding NtrC family response regulator
MGTSRVLVVVDDMPLAELLIEALEDAGHTAVLAATDGLRDEDSFRAAIVDLDTRDRRAWQVARRLRERAPSIKVIVLLPCGGLPPPADQVPHDLAFAKPVRLGSLLTALLQFAK